MSPFSVGMVEQQWSDNQAMERRLNEYSDDLEDIMIKTGIRFENPSPDSIRTSNWLEADADYQFLRLKFQSLKSRAERLNVATSGLAGIVGNRQIHQEQELSLRETQRTKALTLVGLVFIPLAYTATLFSMNERYMPGESKFCVYFVVSALLVFAVILAYVAAAWVCEGGKLYNFGRQKVTSRWNSWVKTKLV
ncbi:hypothetical protein ABW20_dc0110438 [Dactylellina cionopaga]|nr:hypothetical protein ABW20_dc0110438 [Dactylellina cionopaga]